MSGKSPIWVDVRDVVAVHARLLEQHGGMPGLRDSRLLESALARPRQHHAYAESVDIVDMAALYTVAIVKNHPFVDGNKRAGFTAGILFLELNGFEFGANEEDVVRTVFALAAGDLNETGYAQWLRANVKRKSRKH